MTRGPVPEETFKAAAEIGGRPGDRKRVDQVDRDGPSVAIFGTDLVPLFLGVAVVSVCAPRIGASETGAAPRSRAE